MPSPSHESPQLAPIVLFAYKRPRELQLTLQALQANYLANESELYVFVDGPRIDSDRKKVDEVRTIADAISGFKSITRSYSPTNKGLANSVIAGVSSVIARHGSVIVLEDDLLTTPNFLDFMNQALQTYHDKQGLFSITGYTFPFVRPAAYPFDGYLYPRTGSWGWATWANRWQLADWSLTDYKQFISNPAHRREFAYYGSDRPKMLERYRNGKIDSWAIRWCYTQFKLNGTTLHPTLSKVINIGFSDDSTNTHVYNRYRTVADPGQCRQFSFPDLSDVSAYYIKRFRWKFSIPIRISNRILTYGIKLKRLVSKLLVRSA